MTSRGPAHIARAAHVRQKERITAPTLICSSLERVTRASRQCRRQRNGHQMADRLSVSPSRCTVTDANNDDANKPHRAPFSRSRQPKPPAMSQVTAARRMAGSSSWLGSAGDRWGPTASPSATRDRRASGPSSTARRPTPRRIDSTAPMQARQWTDQPAYRRTEGMLLPAPLLASAASRRRGACLLDRLTKRCRAGRAGHG